MKITQKHSTLNQLFEEVKVAGINKTEALEGKNLSGENLSGQDLSHFNLQRVVLNGANLSYCVLNGCNLQNAELRGCDLTNAKLRGSNLSYSNLSKANLQCSDLHGANLNETDVTEADFRNSYGLSQNTKHKLKAQGAFLDNPKNNLRWIEQLWIPIAVGLIVTIFSVILEHRFSIQNPVQFLDFGSSQKTRFR